MPTTSEYLTQLQTDRQTLANNVSAKGVQVPSDATFTELAWLVSTIPTGGVASDYFGNFPGNTTDIKTTLKKVPAVGFNNTSCASTFSGCTQLTDVDLSLFNTSSVTSFKSMFNGCSALTSLNLSTFITTSASRFDYMFAGCSALTSLNLSTFGEGYYTNFASMFYNCTALKEIDLSNFKTTASVGLSSNITNMFGGCLALEKLDMRKFDFTLITGSAFSNMFYGIPNDCLIIVADSTQKDYIASGYSRFTNIKTVAEL